MLARAPNGEQVLALDRGNLRLVNVRNASSAWQTPLPSWNEYSRCNAFFSPRGDYFVLGEEHLVGDTKKLYSVWQTASGHRVSANFEHAFASATLDWGIAVSDDGRWFATNRVRESTDLTVFDLGTQAATVLAVHGAADPARFSADSKLLFVRDEVFALTDEGWKSAARFPGAVDAVWAGQRLAVATPGGVDIWERSGVVHVDYPFAFSQNQNKDPKTNVFLRASERFLAICERAEDPSLLVYDLDRHAQAFARRGLGTIGDVTFRDNRPVVLAFRNDFNTFVLMLDPTNGNVVREKSFGAYGSGGPPVSPHNFAFSPRLLPGGRFIELQYADSLASRFESLD
ncbi:MAG TPA: hypothetical protein VFQ35_13350 [Polyangiaceae bacterium]|nr:hypothetical protein [Polyangiaceae bacterium]